MSVLLLWLEGPGGGQVKTLPQGTAQALWGKRGTGAFLCHSSSQAGRGLVLVVFLVKAGAIQRRAGGTLGSVVEAIGRRAELRDLGRCGALPVFVIISVRVPAGGAGVGGERVFRAAVLRAGLVQALGRVLWRPNQELRPSAWQPGTPTSFTQVMSGLTFGKSEKKIDRGEKSELLCCKVSLPITCINTATSLLHVLVIVFYEYN